MGGQCAVIYIQKTKQRAEGIMLQQSTENILEVNNLKLYFPIRKGFLNQIKGYVKAVDDVSLSIQSGETLGLVGESGCGKTTVGRCLVRAYVPTSGEIWYVNSAGKRVNIASLNRKEMFPYRRELRMMFQDPYSSLNPRMTVLDIVGESLRINDGTRGKELEERVADILEKVGLHPEYMRRYPHAFSGGQRQRIGIARTIALNPKLVIADEAVSALDLSVRAQILKLMQNLQKELNFTYLFISHDLSVVEYMADRVAVMYIGKIVEMAKTDDLYRHPLHPYTETLLSAVPKPNPLQRSERINITGEIPDPANPPPGCYFHPRCRFAIGICKEEAPILKNVGKDHWVGCHRVEELTLKGISVFETNNENGKI
jgi:peptide/nickel transport system ATP-binding protein